MTAASWLQLRVAGESHLVKLTILFPVIGWVLAYDDRLASYLFSKGIHEFEGGSYAAPSSFYYMYFGLLFVGTASVIYQIFCPALIKESASKNDYIERFLLYKNQARIEVLLRSLEGNQSLRKPNDILSVSIVQTLGVGNKSESALTHLLDRYFDEVNGSVRIARIFCTLLYAVGAFVLLVPTMLTSFSIILGAFRSI